MGIAVIGASLKEIWTAAAIHEQYLNLERSIKDNGYKWVFWVNYLGSLVSIQK